MFLNRSSVVSSLLAIPEEKVSELLEFPVVGKDNDGLLITMSLEQYHNLPKVVREEVNTYEEDGYEKMVDNLVILLLHRSSDKPIIKDSMSDDEKIYAQLKEKDLRTTIRGYITENYDIKHFGVGNAYECYISNQLNRTDILGREPPSPAWKIIVEKNNISEMLAMNLRDATKAEGNFIILRLDERTSNIIRRNSAAKPSIIKLKVCNWGWMNECVAKDQAHLGKTSNGAIIPSDQYQSPQTKNPENFPTQIATKQLTLTRQEILESLTLGHTVVDEKNTTDDYLAVKPVPGKNNAPHDIGVIFRANMTSAECIVSLGKTNALMKTIPLVQPDFWKKSWGDYDLSLQHQVKAEYKSSGAKEFSPLEIYTIPVLNDEKRFSVKTAYNPIQHGFENHNPGIQSNIDSLSLAVNPNGLPIKLDNEKKLVKYLSDNTDNQFFHINQNWSMKQNHWGQLVESQIKLGVDVALGTVVALLKEQNKNAQVIFDKSLFDSCLILADKFGNHGQEIRNQLCYLLNKTLHTDHIFTRDDFSKIQSQMNRYDLTNENAGKLESQEAYKVLKEGYTNYLDKYPKANQGTLATESKQVNEHSLPDDTKGSYNTPRSNQ
jgi:hypothetical protein